jgi:hypothetical protein
MKNLIALFSLVTILASNANAQEAPKKYFTLAVAEKNISLIPGEAKSYDITILRSKSYRNTEIALLIDSRLPEGVTIDITDGADEMTNRVMNISVEENTTPFKKAIILKGKSTRFSKGIMINLEVTAESYSAN